MSSKKIIFIADCFAEDVLGGGELNNEEAISLLIERGCTVIKRKCAAVSTAFLLDNQDSFFIIANFMYLRESCKKTLEGLTYIIYEHDHKYLLSRNPADYPDFIAPPHAIVNRSFYQNARAILSQSVLHQQIIEKNLKLSSVINLGGNLWALSDLDKIAELSISPKKNKHAILASVIWHKNTVGAIAHCTKEGWDYELIESSKYHDFLSQLGQCKGLVFLPQTPETLSRLVVEARMMGLEITTHDIVGAMSEKWMELKGPSLIKVMTQKRKSIINKITKLMS